MGQRGRTARLRRLLASLGALIPWTIASAGCGLKTQFPDMRRRLDALPLPDGYELLAETAPVIDLGAKPFGDDRVTRIYRSPQDLEATCDRLQAHLQDRSPTIARHPGGCTVSFKSVGRLAGQAVGHLAIPGDAVGRRGDERTGPGTSGRATRAVYQGLGVTRGFEFVAVRESALGESRRDSEAGRRARFTIRR